MENIQKEVAKIKNQAIDLIQKESKQVEKVISIDKNGFKVDALEMLNLAMKMPGAKVEREEFLNKELKPFFKKEIIEEAIKNNPAYAGIKISAINKIADDAIKYHRNIVASISFATGLPGGFLIAPAIGCDLIQYFYHIIIIAQKLAYLYGFDSFEFDEKKVDAKTMNKLLIFIGVTCGVQEGQQGIKILAQAVEKN